MAVLRTIGQRYELCLEIGAGGMATVHLARQVGAGGFARIVAVKRLHERLSRDPDFVAMFLDEARLVARIRHPNVVQTIDVVADLPRSDPGSDAGDRGELFIVMEYVHGESLLRLFQHAAKTGGVPPRIAAAIIAGALHGLQGAHDACSESGERLGVVHRDVSLHNILVGVDGIARVLDFGVAKASARITTTSAGLVKGKLSYMAPEQVRSGPVDRRTDVYATSVVLWELLTGRRLFRGANEAATVHRILIEPVPAPSQVNGHIPPALDEIVMRGLARDPDARFASAHAMALAIERATGTATADEVGSWVGSTCRQELASRQRFIASVEAKASSRNHRNAVDSLGMMTTAPSAKLHPISETPRGSTSASLEIATEIGPLPSFPPIHQTIGAPQAAITRARTRILLAAAVSAPLLALGLLAFAHGRGALPKPAPIVQGLAVVRTVDAIDPPVTTMGSCPLGMVVIPGGRFFMGSDEDLPAEKPAHNVTLRPFCMDRYEVSSDSYRACSDRGDCKRAGQTNRWSGITSKDQRTFDPLCNGPVEGRGRHPINCVDWSMADRFCRAAGKRLPTEAEWEFAARGSDGRKYPWGDEAPTSKHLNACGSECVAWLKKRGAQTDGFLYPDSDGWSATAPVGAFPVGASRWGVEDIVGNVWEWVSDWYGAYPVDDQVAPAGAASGKERVIRGGAWNGAYTDWVRPTFRYQAPPETRSHGIGFRCAQPL